MTFYCVHSDAALGRINQPFGNRIKYGLEMISERPIQFSSEDVLKVLVKRVENKPRESCKSAKISVSRIPALYSSMRKNKCKHQNVFHIIYRII